MHADDGYAGHWLANHEGVTQGNPFTMIIYGIGMLLLTKMPKMAVPRCLQPWYTDDAADGGNFDEVEKCLVYYKLRGQREKNSPSQPNLF